MNPKPGLRERGYRVEWRLGSRKTGNLYAPIRDLQRISSNLHTSAAKGTATAFRFPLSTHASESSCHHAEIGLADTIVMAELRGSRYVMARQIR